MRQQRASVDRQAQTCRCCAAGDLGSSVDTVVVGWQPASLPAFAVSTGEIRSPWAPRRQTQSFTKYPLNDLEFAHGYPPILIGKYLTAIVHDIDQNQIKSTPRSAEKRVGYAESQCRTGGDLILINFTGLFSANVFASTVGGCLMEPPKIVPR
jgi:hypothetical protein